VEPTKEQLYLRRIAELEKENAELRQQNAELRRQNGTLTEQIAMLTDQVAKLTEQVARLSKNSSNSSKPPSSDIVKPPKGNNTGGPRRQGGQPGHKGSLARRFGQTRLIVSKNLILPPVHCATTAPLSRPARSRFSRSPNCVRIHLKSPSITFMDVAVRPAGRWCGLRRRAAWLKVTCSARVWKR